MKSEFEIYTDGACIGNGQRKNIGGWGFVCIERGKHFYETTGIEYNTTNNRQEILAVLNALRCCKEYNITSFTIYSDSQYVVNGFNNWMHKWKKKNWIRGTASKPQPVINKDLWQEMYKIRFEFDKVDLKWVRGHNGNKWNEHIDELINTHINAK